MQGVKPLYQAKPTAQLLFKETDEVFQTNVESEEGGRQLDITAKVINAALNEVGNAARESDEDNNDDGDFDEEYEEDDDDQSASSVLLAEVFHETNKLAIERNISTEDSGTMMMPNLASISQESFFNGTNDMSFGSSVVLSFGASFAMGHKSASFGAPDLDPITETIEKIVIEDGSSDMESHHRSQGMSSIQLDELQPRWDNSSDHSKQGCQRWDTSDSSYKKDSMPRIIRH
jgi:hypothetical protein